MLSVTIMLIMLCHYAECSYAECRSTLKTAHIPVEAGLGHSILIVL
jgi:hypothetical protein